MKQLMTSNELQMQLLDQTNQVNKLHCKLIYVVTNV
jgi:hypothetical protein